MGAVRLSETWRAALSRSVIRTRLIERLADGGQDLIVICAPAGSGKSTLARQWITGAALLDRTVWITVRAAEQDPQRLWRECLAGLRDVWGEPPDPRGFTATGAAGNLALFASCT